MHVNIDAQPDHGSDLSSHSLHVTCDTVTVSLSRLRDKDRGRPLAPNGPLRTGCNFRVQSLHAAFVVVPRVACPAARGRALDLAVHLTVHDHLAPDLAAEAATARARRRFI